MVYYCKFVNARIDGWSLSGFQWKKRVRTKEQKIIEVKQGYKKKIIEEVGQLQLTRFNEFIVIMKSEQRFQVFVRVRPYTQKELEEIGSVEQVVAKKQTAKLSPHAYNFLTRFHPSDLRTLLKVEDNCLQVVDNQYKSLDRRYRPYYFNQILGETSSNSHIFSHLEKNVERLFEGFNFTIFTYGITGSGKTHTVFGSPKDQEQKGLCHLIYQYLLRRKKEIQTVTDNVVKLKYSFFEIYNENVRDLLSGEAAKNLNIVEDSKGNTIVSQLFESEIHNLSDLYACVNQGYLKRALTSTNNNVYSSRSHALQLLQIEVENSNGYKNISKLYIVDLAGSEKVQSSKNKCIQEGANINKSLLALANCITLLAANKSSNHIPYRDSKLTRILKESLGGNANTLMITCISPNPFLIEQTVTTLNYATRASGIQKKITRNIVEPQAKAAKQNIRASFTPTKVRQGSITKRIPEFDSTTWGNILSDIRQNAVQRQNLEELLRICKQHHRFEIEGALTVNECQKNQLQNILKGFLKGAPLNQIHLNSVSKYNSERKVERSSLKFERRPRGGSLSNTIR